jgi:hypothetical protein
MPKRLETEIGCGSFDQRDLQSLNDYILILDFMTGFLRIWERIIYR